jgi:hypothetical protein
LITSIWGKYKYFCSLHCKYLSEIYPAEWKKYGRSAGPKRNKQMADVADFAIAFPTANGKVYEEGKTVAF